MKDLQNFKNFFEEIQIKNELKKLEEEDSNLGQYFKSFYWIMVNYFRAKKNYIVYNISNAENEKGLFEETIIAIDDVITLIF